MLQIDTGTVWIHWRGQQGAKDALEEISTLMAFTSGFIMSFPEATSKTMAFIPDVFCGVTFTVHIGKCSKILSKIIVFKTLI